MSGKDVDDSRTLNAMPDGSSLGDYVEVGLRGAGINLDEEMRARVRRIAIAWGNARAKHAVTHTPVQEQIDMLQARIKELEDLR